MLLSGNIRDSWVDRAFFLMKDSLINKCSLIKRSLIRFTDQLVPKNTQHLLVWVYHECCVYILWGVWVYYIQYLCWFCTAKTSLHLPLHHALCSLVKTLHVCVFKELTAICNWMKKKKEAEISKVNLHWNLPSSGKTNMLTLWLFPKFYVFFAPIVCLV